MVWSVQVCHNLHPSRKTAINPRAPSQPLQASDGSLNVLDSEIRKRLNECGLFLSRKNMAAWLRFAKLYLKNPPEQCPLYRWDQKWRYLSRINSRTLEKYNNSNNNKKAYQHKHFKPTVSTMMEGWWFGHLGVTELTINSSVYQSVLESDLRTYVWQLKVRPNQLDNNAKPTNPDLKLTEMLW